MTFSHIPVLFDEVMAALPDRPDGIFVDGTLGGGGHSEGILKTFPQAVLYGLDRDPSAIAAASERLRGYPGFHAVRANFHDAKDVLAREGIRKVDCVLLDLGVSSPQLDVGERGFSYHTDAPLDMRMDPDQAVTAEEIVNTLSEAELTRILRDYGEEKWAARIAAIICEHRKKERLKTTGDLVACVDAAIPKAVRRKDDGHPARRTFQAIRIAVNDELEPLDRALTDFVDMLNPGGRLLVISFHSLEDRIVKRAMQELATGCTCPPEFPVCVCGRKSLGRVITRKPVVPTPGEIEHNPRAASAKLRVFEHI